jgi:hypothetical protein
MADEKEDPQQRLRAAKILIQDFYKFFTSPDMLPVKIPVRAAIPLGRLLDRVKDFNIEEDAT